MKNKAEKPVKISFSQWWGALSDTTQKIAQFVGAVTVLVGVIVGCITWATNTMNDTIDEKVAEIAETSKLDNQRNYLSIQRVELMLLMKNYPTNIVEIEATAKEYFDAGGNHYMRTLYNEWCHQYDETGCNIMLKK